MTIYFAHLFILLIDSSKWISSNLQVFFYSAWIIIEKLKLKSKLSIKTLYLLRGECIDQILVRFVWDKIWSFYNQVFFEKIFKSPLADVKPKVLLQNYILHFWKEMGHLLKSHLLEKTARHQKYMKLLKNQKRCHFEQMQVLDQNKQLLKLQLVNKNIEKCQLLKL